VLDRHVVLELVACHEAQLAVRALAHVGHVLQSRAATFPADGKPSETRTSTDDRQSRGRGGALPGRGEKLPDGNL
jgi:hypothetical protein